MKWFKHESDAHTNLKLQQVIGRFGMEAFGYYWFLLEIIGKEGENFRLTNGKNWIIFAENWTRIAVKRQQEYLNFFADINLIDKKALKNRTLYIPKLAERSDEYTKRVRRLSVHSTDNVPLEQKRTEQKRTEEMPAAQTLNKLRDQIKQVIKKKSI